MNCPRCKTAIGPLSDPDSIVTCSGCGSRLMTRSAALRSQGGPKPVGTASDPSTPHPSPPSPFPADHHPSATLPPTPAMLLGLKRPPEPVLPPAAADTTRRGGKKGEAKPAAKTEETLDLLVKEIRALREAQNLIIEVLQGLRHAPAGPPPPPPEAAGGGAGTTQRTEGPFVSPIRARRQKTVVLVDDDAKTREAAVAELQHANVPVRAFGNGNAALGAIAEEKPDVIVLELGMGGDMGGKDLVNMIKATMEWVEIPIILWTREAVASQKEARQIHGADEVVVKSSGAGALVARVITVFRRP